MQKWKRVVLVVILFGSSVGLFANVKKCKEDCRTTFKQCMKDAITLGIIAEQLCLSNGGTTSECKKVGVKLAKLKRQVCKIDRDQCLEDCKNE